jgi:signal recognition particle receptor subunit beta
MRVDGRGRTRAKLVLFGPAMAGRMTMLEQFARLLPPPRGELTTVETASWRAVMFDFPDPGRRALLFDAWSMPGSVYYAEARREMLQGCDGVLFVADSTRLDENLASLRELEKHLGALDRVPLVFAYNKRDLPDALATAKLDAALNRRGSPAVPTIASRGDGVVEAFTRLCSSIGAE